MKSTIQASLVIPLFNNEKTLVTQIKKCISVMEKTCQKYEIIVCDDKSTDTSATLLHKYFSAHKNIQIIFHHKNQGIAKTLKSLYKKARYEYITLFSVDGDWNPEDLGRLLVYAKKQDAEIVIGKRTYKEYSIYRKIISFFYNFLPVIFFGVRTMDAGSIKVFKRDVYRKTKLISKNVFFEAEFIIRANKSGDKIVSIPISFKKREKKGNGGKLFLVISSLIDLINLRLRF